MMLERDGNGLYNLRVRYRKRGDLKYISHLDMNRLMQRALSRSRLPVWHTQGFNPHLYLTFALPLSLGFESDCELMDMRLREPMDTEEVVHRLGREMPGGLTVTGAAAPLMDVREIAACDYEISLETPGGAGRALEALRELMGGPIPVEKKTKKGTRAVDIRPQVELMRSAPDDGGDLLSMALRCASGSETNVNPALLVGALCAKTGGDARDASYLKTEIWARNGEKFC